VRDIVSILVDEALHLEVKPDVDEVCSYKSACGAAAVREVGMPAIDVVVKIARRYHGQLPMAVASSGSRTHVEESLRANGILDLFDTVVTVEDVANPKPAPDIFLLAAHRIGCNPAKCRGYEDGDVGIQALVAAGMEPVDVRLLHGYPTVQASELSTLKSRSLNACSSVLETGTSSLKDKSLRVTGETQHHLATHQLGGDKPRIIWPLVIPVVFMLFAATQVQWLVIRHTDR
jgi:beta-phosphoglucomutase-like phosphatase (HAD superfamily)